MTPDEAQHQFEKLMFSVRRSRRYHLYRQRFFNRLDFWSGFLTTLMTTSVFVLGITEKQLPLLIVAGLTALAKLLGFAGQTTKRAVLHSGLAVDFTALERDMVLAEEGGITSKKLRGFMARRLDIEIREPPPIRTLDTIAHNDEIKAGGYGEGYEPLSRWQEWLAPVFDLGARSSVLAGKSKAS